MAAGWNVDSVTVSTSAVILTGGATVANRDYLEVFNAGHVPVFLGPAGVTVATGFTLLPGKRYRLAEVDSATGIVTALYGIAGQSVEVKVLESEATP
jgi:hypothetical protein